MTRDEARAELTRRGLDWKTGKPIAKTQAQQPFDWKATIGTATKKVFQEPAQYAKNLATNPETMVNALPTAMGAGGAAMFPFGGGTIGTALGQGIRDVSLKKVLKKPIPSLGQHALELGSSLGGDLVSGLIQKGIYAKDIATAEEGLANVPKAAPASNPRTAIKLVQQINDAPTMSPAQAKALKPAFRTIWKSGWVWSNPYKEYLPDIVKASQKIQASLNELPGRAEAAQELRRVMTMPNKLGAPGAWLWRNLPKLAARGARWGIIGVP